MATRNTCRLSSKDWCEVGLDRLTQGGADALTIGRIASHLNVTYGSFYSHFDSADTYFRAVLEHWYSCNLKPFARQFLGTPTSTMKGLVEAVSEAGFDEVETAIRRWADTYGPAACTVRQADRYRVRVLTQLLESNGLETPMARAQGQLMLTAYIGSLTLAPADRAETLEALTQLIDSAAREDRQVPQRVADST